jgi:hypothetical protein
MDPMDAGASDDPVRRSALGSLRLTTVSGGGAVCLTWRAADVDGIVDRLRRAGLVVTIDEKEAVVGLGLDRVRIRATDRRDELVVHAASGGGVVDGGHGARLAAIGFATVDHERVAQELGVDRLLGPVDEPALGARAWRPEAGRLLLLEPSTEGRLAASLARLGEGPRVLYLAVDAAGVQPELGERAHPTALAVPGVLILAGSRWGPFVVLTNHQ